MYKVTGVIKNVYLKNYEHNEKIYILIALKKATVQSSIICGKNISSLQRKSVKDASKDFFGKNTIPRINQVNYMKM